MKNKQLIIFDCDGVLVDSEKTTNQVLATYLNEFGLDFTAEKALTLFRGGALADCIEYVKTEYGVELPEDFPIHFRKRMKVAFEKSLEPVKNVKPLLDHLTSKKDLYSICVASNGPIEKMDTTLKVTDIKKYFGESVYSAYQVNKWKPDPTLFLHAASETGGFEAEDCVVIEDSPRGAEAAKAAGMKCFGFAIYNNEEGLKAQGAELFYDMLELVDKF